MSRETSYFLYLSPKWWWKILCKPEWILEIIRIIWNDSNLQRSHSFRFLSNSNFSSKRWRIVVKRIQTSKFRSSKTEQPEFRKSNHRFFPIQETNVDLVTRWRAEEAARWSGEERQRRGKESRFPYLSTDRRDIVDLAIEAKSDFPSPALESSRRRFSSFAHGSLPTPLPLRLVRSRNSPQRSSIWPRWAALSRSQ